MQAISVRYSHHLIRFLTIVFGVGLLFASAEFVIPWEPVPFTLQSITVLFIAMTLPLSDAFVVVFGYLALGAMGLPIFGHFTSGTAVLFGSNAGYFLGFLVATPICAAFQPKSFAGYLTMTTVGIFVIFFCGVGVLAHFIGWKAAFAFGALPFIATEPLKMLGLDRKSTRLNSSH